MANESNLTADTLRQLLSYDATTGVFYWNIQKGPRKAGERAGRISSSDGYVYICINYVSYCAHRLVWLYVKGEWPSMFVDHINNNRSDNRIDNLRQATHAQNMSNRPRNSNNKTGIKGVSYEERYRKYRAVIRVNYKQKFLGYYDTPEEAGDAYRVAATAKFGEFAQG